MGASDPETTAGAEAIAFALKGKLFLRIIRLLLRRDWDRRLGRRRH
jgi:hypothetical protein